MKLVHLPLMGGKHLLLRGGGAPQPAQVHPRCTKCNSSPIIGQCTNQPIAVITVRCSAVSMCPLKG